MCPNWWPPTAIKGGQAFEQAPHLMQVSASRISGSARIASRPLSRTTQCISRGPCAPMTGLKPMSEERDGPVTQFTYVLIGWPVAERASIFSSEAASSTSFTTLSIPKTAI